MVKSKKGKVIQMLSPENYIRKKARTLPLFECLVASDWEKTKMTSVVIARKHTNGNITACSYVVDLACLGVKDTLFLFNVSLLVFSDFKDKLNTRMVMTEVDYPLAHNIILAGVEYAAEFGFKPCKDYESITKFMLEEDTEEIELIEIICGTDGKPMYIQGPFEDDVRARQVIAQLEKTAGHGNYNFIMSGDDQFEDDYEDEDEDEDEDDDDEDDEYEFDDWPFEEKRELFLTLSKDIDDPTEEEFKRLFHLTNSMGIDLLDVDQHNKFYDQYKKELDFAIEVDEVPVELLGLKPGDQPVPEELINRFMDIYQLSSDDPEMANKELKLFHKESNAIPGAYLLELLILQTQHSPKYIKQLKKYAETFPDYALIQLLWATSQVTSPKDQSKIQIPFLLLRIHETSQVTSPKDQSKIPGHSYKMESFFPGRKSIHPIELLYSLVLYSFATGVDLDINKIEAFGSVLSDFELPKPVAQILLSTNSMFKFSYLMKMVRE